MAIPESETIDYPRKREEKTQNTCSHDTVKLEKPTQLERTITKPQNNEGLNTKHQWKIKQWIRKFDPNRVHYIQYAVTSTSFNIFGEGIHNKFIRATSYTLSKGPSRDNLPYCVHTAENLK